jgi:hypothetical protein
VWRSLTVIATGDATALAAVLGGAGILLKAGVGHTAGALRNRAVVVLTDDDLEAGRGGRSGRGEGGKAEDDGGERELHLDGRVGGCLKRLRSLVVSVSW